MNHYVGLNTMWRILALLCVVFVAFDAAAGEPPSHHDVYKIGPNDVIRIQVFGEEDLTVEKQVGGDGKIDYPLLGSVPVAGKTVEEIQRHLSTQLNSGYIRHPKVSVSIIRHRNFYVGGEVKLLPWPGGSLKGQIRRGLR
jgi:polysaccharide export outer membrane protein